MPGLAFDTIAPVLCLFSRLPGVGVMPCTCGPLDLLELDQNQGCPLDQNQGCQVGSILHRFLGSVALMTRSWAPRWGSIEPTAAAWLPLPSGLLGTGLGPSCFMRSVARSTLLRTMAARASVRRVDPAPFLA